MSDYFEVITNAKTGVVTQRPLTASEIATLQPTAEELSADIRATRNQLLSESDWTQVLDAPVDQVAWSDYRKGLRDITGQTGFPQNVTWPIKPE